MDKAFLRLCAIAVFLGMSGLATPAGAEDEKDEISGFAFVKDCGLLTIGGRDVALWGIVMPDPDQLCWNAGISWPCGEQALLALKHFAEEKFVTCQIVAETGGGKPAARCFRRKGPVEHDVAGFLVLHGWAIADLEEEDENPYMEEENHARLKKRGLWSGRFQTPEDWREGVQRFVGEDEEPENNPKEDEAEDGPGN